MAPRDEFSRHISLDKSYNVRDLGGYATTDARRTRWRTILRGDALHRLTTVAQAQVIDAGVRTIVDLRWSFELAEAPNVFAGSPAVRYYHLSLLDDLQQPSDLPEPGFATYRMMLDDCQEMIRMTLATLAAPCALPALFHCTAGKDRTGVVSALLLGLANVPRETIVADYVLSNHYLSGGFYDDVRRRVVARGDNWDNVRPLLVCHPEAMSDTLAYLDSGYGGIVPYLERIGVAPIEIESLRQALTEPDGAGEAA